jgi:hypothetical protein
LPYEIVRKRFDPTREEIVATDLARAPSAMLYSRVPLVGVSSMGSHSAIPLASACRSSVVRDTMVSSVRSVSKKTRSPTLTTKSCQPGVAVPRRAGPGRPGLLAQAAAIRAMPTIITGQAPREMFVIIIR